MVSQKAITNAGYVGPDIKIKVKSIDFTAQEGQQKCGGLHPCALLLLNCTLSQSTVILHFTL